MASAAQSPTHSPTKSPTVTGPAPESGGSFVHQAAQSPIFTPEQLSEEQIQLYETASDFMRANVMPRTKAIDAKEPGVLTDLMAKAAELGLFMAEIPEAHGGLGLDKATSMLISEALCPQGSFAVTYGAHTGIGTLPIVYYGTEEQKAAYLPKLASGEMIGAYCLSEQGSGSDALAAKTTAKLSADGSHYVLNGTKFWITNGALADLFTVFAQVVDEDGGNPRFTAFLVERSTPGVSIGKEEHKLGIRGSSTTAVMLDDVEVPVANVLGEVGRGHKIAFNILNIGRWKLGAAAVGGSKYALALGVRYAKDRYQFKRPIASFGLIRKKLAESAMLIYAGESMAYRTAGAIDRAIARIDHDDPDYDKKAVKAIEEYTIEASILKVFGSEAMMSIADEMLQVHGGNGFTEDYEIERLLRDARINRIFEGTNEINRLIVPATLLKRALQGRVPLMQLTQQVIGELQDPDSLPKKGTGPLADEVLATDLVRRAIVYGASYAAQKYLDDLKNKQRILGALADSIIALYAMDSVVTRARQAVESESEDGAAIHVALAKLYCFEGRWAIFQTLRRVAMLMAEGEELDALYANLGKLDQRYRADIMGLQETVAEYLLAHDGYVVGANCA